MTLIIDANNLIYRTFFVAKKQQKQGKKAILNEKGMDCSVIHSFFNSLYFLMDTYKPQKTFLCWDKKANKNYTGNFRYDLVDDYKAGRGTSDEDREEINSFMAPLYFLCSKLGIKSMFPYNLEADDILWWLTQNIKGDIMIATSDKDMLQLVGPKVSYHNFSSKGVINIDNFYEKVGCDIENFLLIKAIQGDKSDNIEGLMGYGKIKSKKLADSWHDKRHDLSDEQLKTIERNLTVMTLGAKMDKDELKALEIQFADYPAIDFETFDARARSKYNLSRLYRNKWKDLLRKLDRDTNMTDIKESIFKDD